MPQLSRLGNMTISNRLWTTALMSKCTSTHTYTQMGRNSHQPYYLTHHGRHCLYLLEQTKLSQKRPQIYLVSDDMNTLSVNFHTQKQMATLMEHYTVCLIHSSLVCIGFSEWSIRNPAAMQRSNPSTPETAARTMRTSAKNQSQQVLHASKHNIDQPNTGQDGVWTKFQSKLM